MLHLSHSPTIGVTQCLYCSIVFLFRNSFSHYVSIPQATTLGKRSKSLQKCLAGVGRKKEQKTISKSDRLQFWHCSSRYPDCFLSKNYILIRNIKYNIIVF